MPDDQTQPEAATPEAIGVRSVGVVGAGQMGNGIAHVFALAGYDVCVADVSQDALDRARGLIERNMERQVSRGKIGAQAKAEAMGRIRTTLKLAELGPSDLVIEAATERESVKTAIFEDLQPHLKPETILTSNTSSISITRLASPHRPAGTVHGLPLHEPRAGDAARRADPRHRHRAGGLPDLPPDRGEPGQDGRERRGLPGLHRQPHPDADDQRGGLHALRGRGHRDLDRHLDEARRQPPDGAAWSSPTSSGSTPAWRS